MSFSYGGQIGSAINVTDSTSTKTFTVGAGGVPAGALVVLAVARTTTVPATITATDSKSNTYAQQARVLEPIDNQGNILLMSILGTALVSGDTITVTYGTGFSEKLGLAFYWTAGGTIAFGSAATATNSTASKTTGSITVGATTELLIGTFAQNTGSTLTYTAGSGFTQAAATLNGGTELMALFVEYDLAADATGAQTIPATSSAAGSSANIGARFTESAGSGATVTAVAQDSTGDLLAPAITAESTITSVVIDGTGACAAPTVTGNVNSTVTAVALAGTGDCIAPTVTGGTAPFPTTSVLDNFNRADGALGANWGNDPFDTGTVAPVIATNQVAQASVGSAFVYWSAASFGPDAEAYITVANVGSQSPSYYQVFARLQQPGAGVDCYEVACTHDVGNDTWAIYRINDGGTTTLTSQATGPELTNGDKIGIEVLGSGATVTINCWRFNSSTWTKILTYNDTAAGRITTSGYIGFGVIDGAGTTTRLDDFSGGTVASSANATVTAVPCDGVGDVPVPTVSGASTVTSPLLPGLGDLVPPSTLMGSVLVAVGSLDAVGDIIVPTVFGFSLLDNFNRADESPIASPWSPERIDQGITNGLRVVGNQLAASSSSGNGYLLEIFTLDNEFGVDVAVAPSAVSTSYIALFIQGQGMGTNAWTGYKLKVDGTGSWILSKSENGTPESLGTFSGPTLAVGDTLWFRQLGTVLTGVLERGGERYRVFDYDDGAAPNPLVAPFSTSGIEIGSTAVRLDNYKRRSSVAITSKSYFCSSSTGSDSNTGTYVSPFLTAQKLIDSMSPGDFGYIREGTYTPAGSYVLDFVAGGSSGSPLTIKPYPGETVTLNRSIRIADGKDYITISGRGRTLHLVGTDGQPYIVQVSGDNCVLEECDLTYPSGAGIKVGVSGSSTANNLIIQRNFLHDIGQTSGVPVDAHAIYPEDAVGGQVVDNVLANVTGFDIYCYGAVDGMTFNHNVLDSPGQSCIMIGGYGDASPKVTKNCIFSQNLLTNADSYGVEGYWDGTTPAGTGNLVSNNVYFEDFAGLSIGTGFTLSGNVNVDPQYVDQPAQDLPGLRMALGSPALSTVTYDTARLLLAASDSFITSVVLDSIGDLLVPTSLDVSTIATVLDAIGSLPFATPDISASIDAANALALGFLMVPVVNQVDNSVFVPPLLGTASVPAPNVGTQGNVNILAVACMTVGSIVAPSPSASSLSVFSTAISVPGDLVTPLISAGFDGSGMPALSGLGTFPAPVPSTTTGVGVVAVVLDGTGDVAGSPAVAGNASVVSPMLSATGLMPWPTSPNSVPSTNKRYRIIGSDPQKIRR